jgi:SNF2 family DNA or RNA helicase
MSEQITYLPHQKEVAKRIQGQHGLLVYNSVGSGKSISAILAAEGLKDPATVIAPAATLGNFKREKQKVNTKVPYTIQSYEKFLQNPKLTTPTLIIDESQRLRNIETSRAKALTLAAQNAKRVILLSGTPIVNTPDDISPVINMAAGSQRLPTDKKMFDDHYIRTQIYTPGMIGALFGRKPSEYKYMINKDDFKKRISGLVHFYDNKNNKKDFPEVIEKSVKVPLTSDQIALYNFYQNKLPQQAKQELQYSLSPSKKTSGPINAFLSQTRQIVNSPEAFMNSKEPSPKFKAVVDNIKNSRGPTVVYSNFLQSGINPISDLLNRHSISNATFTGKLKQRERDTILKDFNRGKIKSLLISPSGGEAINLRGVRQVHLVESAWNEPKLQQALGRAIRYKSHTHLPSKDRNVTVFRYSSEFPAKPQTMIQKILHITPERKTSVDEYLANLSKRKEQLNNQFLDVLKEEGKSK